MLQIIIPGISGNNYLIKSSAVVAREGCDSNILVAETG